MRNHPGRRIQTEHLGEPFNEVYTKAACLKNASAGFRRSGIVPFDSDIIPNYEFIEDPRSVPTASSTMQNEVPPLDSDVTDPNDDGTIIPTIVEKPATGANSPTTSESSTTGNTMPVPEVPSVSFDDILAVLTVLLHQVTGEKSRKLSQVHQIRENWFKKRKIVTKKNKEIKKAS